MARKRSAVPIGQEVLRFEGNPVVPFILKEADIQKGASYRRKRKKDDPVLGDLALNKRTLPCDQKNGRLWVPRSAGEFTLVSKGTESYLKQESHRTRRRIIDKHADNPDISRQNVEIRASFAVGSARSAIKDRISKYIIDSNSSIFSLRDILTDELRPNEYDHDKIRDSELCMDGIASYIVDLTSYTGASVKDNEKRKWIQNNHIHKLREAKDLAYERMDKLPTHGLEQLYFEALCSATSRKRYWDNEVKSIEDRRQERLATPPEYVQVPLEVYELSAESDTVY